MAGVLQSPYLERAAVVAGKRLTWNEGGYGGWRGLVGGNGVQHLAQAGAVALPVVGTAEFPVPKEPKRTDFSAAIQTGQTKLSVPRFTAAVTFTTS